MGLFFAYFFTFIIVLSIASIVFPLIIIMIVESIRMIKDIIEWEIEEKKE